MMMALSCGKRRVQKDPPYYRTPGAAMRGNLNGFGPTRHAELFEQLAKMRLHRALAGTELGRHFLVALNRRPQPGDGLA